MPARPETVRAPLDGVIGRFYVQPNQQVQAGQLLFDFDSAALAARLEVAQQTLEKTGITADELDVFIPHQANMRIVDALARAAKLPDKVQVADDITHMGNTSAASVPLAMHAMLADGRAKSGDTALLIAFGAGLAYAAQVVTIP